MENRFYFGQWGQDGDNTVSAYIIDSQTDLAVDTAYLNTETGEQFTHHGKTFANYGLTL